MPESSRESTPDFRASLFCRTLLKASVPATDQFDDDYQELIREHQNLLHAFIFAICPNHAAADDIQQETNRVLGEKRHQFELGTNFSAWCRKIAHFQTLNYLKQNKRKSWLRFDSDLVQVLARELEERDETRDQKRGR